VQSARLGLRINEIGVPRIYLDPSRAFGGMMNDADARLAYYRRVLESAQNDLLPATARDKGAEVSQLSCEMFRCWEPCR